MVSVIRGDDNFDSSSVGPSTTAGDVGTYVLAQGNNTAFGTTLAGSSLRPAAFRSSGAAGNSSYSSYYFGMNDGTLTGTWRRMGGRNTAYGSNITLWVRIS